MLAKNSPFNHNQRLQTKANKELKSNGRTLFRTVLLKIPAFAHTLTALAGILISFTLSVRSDHCFTLFEESQMPQEVAKILSQGK
jgi:hypothetical protein